MNKTNSKRHKLNVTKEGVNLTSSFWHLTSACSLERQETQIFLFLPLFFGSSLARLRMLTSSRVHWRNCSPFTFPVVFAWLPVFPCFRVFSIDRFNPLLSLFRVSFQCWKRIKLKKVRTCTVLTCTMAIMRSAKPLPPFLQLICTATAANDCTNPHFLM